MEPFKGGNWTESKVKAIKSYLEAYAQIMKNKGSKHSEFQKIYFDAFCGSGSRLGSDRPDLFGGEGLTGFTSTSPKIALDIRPAFNAYYFCDIKSSYVESLRARISDECAAVSNVNFQVGDANELISEFCRKTNWKGTRCVMFLDPLGTSVKWSTIKIIAATKAIDLWYLFPSGLGPVRMLPKSGNISEKWAETLTQLWGDESWLSVGYSIKEPTNDLFGIVDAKIEKTGTAVDFEKAFIVRLREIFGGVSEHSLRLLNSKNSHMFSLLFACANPSPAAYGPALRVADHILRM